MIALTIVRAVSAVKILTGYIYIQIHISRSIFYFCEAFSVGDTNCLQGNYTGCDILGYFDVRKHKHK